jgi:hypothetical protein
MSAGAAAGSIGDSGAAAMSTLSVAAGSDFFSDFVQAELQNIAVRRTVKMEIRLNMCVNSCGGWPRHCGEP